MRKDVFLSSAYDTNPHLRQIDDRRQHYQQQRMIDEGRQTLNNEWMDANATDGSMIGSVLGGIFCFLLFLLIIFSVAYPFTMYKTNPNYEHYPDEKWWCYHCSQSWCANKCWYNNN